MSTTIPDDLHDPICGSTADYQIFKKADGATDGANLVINIFNKYYITINLKT